MFLFRFFLGFGVFFTCRILSGDCAVVNTCWMKGQTSDVNWDCKERASYIFFEPINTDGTPYCTCIYTILYVLVQNQISMCLRIRNHGVLNLRQSIKIGKKVITRDMVWPD